MTKQDNAKRDADDSLDDALDQSFPTSDPPSQTNPSVGTQTNPVRSKDRKPTTPANDTGRA